MAENPELLRKALDQAISDQNDAAAKDLAARIVALEKQVGIGVGSHAPKQQGPFSDMSRRDLVRSYGQGGSFGAQDEIHAGIGAGLDTLTTGEDYLPNYRSLRDIERQDQAQFAGNHPVLDFGTQMAGGISLPGLAGYSTAEKTGRSLTGIGMAEGAAAGYGYSNAEDFLGSGDGVLNKIFGGQAGDVALGTGGGALFGWATPKIMNAGRNIGTGVGRVARDLASDEGDAQARRAIEKAMQRDGLTLQQAQQKLREQGPEAMLADLGPNLKSLGRETTAQPGPALTTASKALDERSAGRPERLVGYLEDTSQRSVNDFSGTLKQTAQIREKEGAKLFKEAFAQPLEPTDELVRLSQSGYMQDAMKVVQGRVARADAESGGTLEMLHMVKEQLWDEAAALKRVGRMREAAKIDDIRIKMVAELDKSNAVYRRARNLWAGTKEIDDAAQLGRKLFTGKQHADEVQDLVSTMTDTEKDAFQIGAVRGLFDFLEESGDIGRAKQLLRKPRYKKLLGQIFPNDEAEEAFLSKLLIEQGWQETSNQALGGSNTARILAGQADASMQTGVLNAAKESLITGNLPFASILGSVTKRLAPNIADETVEVIGEALFGQMTPERLARLLQRSRFTRISPQPGALSRLGGASAASPGVGALTEGLQ